MQFWVFYNIISRIAKWLDLIRECSLKCLNYLENNNFDD